MRLPAENARAGQSMTHRPLLARFVVHIVIRCNRIICTFLFTDFFFKFRCCCFIFARVYVLYLFLFDMRKGKAS